MNAGDWVISCTAVMERPDGTLELFDWEARAAISSACPASITALDLSPAHVVFSKVKRAAALGARVIFRTGGADYILPRRVAYSGPGFLCAYQGGFARGEGDCSGYKELMLASESV